jgi:hypothetical protein
MSWSLPDRVGTHSKTREPPDQTTIEFTGRSLPHRRTTLNWLWPDAREPVDAPDGGCT